MTIVSSKDFATNQEKYFDLALDEQVFIRKGDNMFLLLYKNIDDMNTYHDAGVYEEILEPDDDLRSAITMDALRGKVHDLIDRLYSNDSKSDTEGI